MAASDEDIRALVWRTCHAMNEEDFDGFLSFCAPSFRYRITAHSPEIDKEMIWLDQDYDGLAALLEVVPHHLRRVGRMHRHVTVGVIERDGSEANVTSSFLVIDTNLEGQSQLFAAGLYEDRIETEGEAAPRLLQRRVKLETRDLGIGSHVPF